MNILLFAAGLAFLIIGAEALVRGASKIAAGMGISPLVIGLTIVAFGTSAPELAVSIKSSLAGQADIALGNVVGSNIFNVLFILGVSALIIPLRVSPQLIRFDVPVMIGLSGIVLLFSLDHSISRIDGLLLVLGLLVYTGYLFYESRKSPFGAVEYTQKLESDPTGQTEPNWPVNIALIVIGLILLIIGSRWLVNGAVSFAQYLGISELIIGLTIVAAGTSLPEIVTSIIAAIRGERDIAVGNVIGSNIFNILGVLGIAGIVVPSGIAVSDAMIGFDIPIMIAMAIACLPLFFTKGTIHRWEGIVLIGYYLAYTLYLVLAASSHESLPAYSSIMLYYVLPITILTLIVVVAQELCNYSKGSR